MQTNVIQRQYDEVIAARYDRDPQSVVGDSLNRAIAQLEQEGLLEADERPCAALDLGVGTGRFLEMLIRRADRRIQPAGLDLAEKMIEIARARIPELTAIVQDARHFDEQFPEESFDLIATHFVTGFVPMRELAPKIWGRLSEGGYWSFVGGTKAGFPELQRKTNTRAMKWFSGTCRPAVDDVVCNPADQAEVVRTLEATGFAVRQKETFQPEVHFADLEEFLEFAYWGGWLTPFIEAMGLHKASLITRFILNTFFFAVHDHHSIEIVLAQKVGRPLTP